MNFPNYDAIEAISSINISSQALQQQALPFFSQPMQQGEQHDLQRLEIIKIQAEKIKENADKILQSLLLSK